MEVTPRVYVGGVPSSQRMNAGIIEGVVIARGFFRDLVAFPGRDSRRRKTLQKWIAHPRLKPIPAKSA